ncbi:hypothetical protein BU24DRAFT_417690 [Aaosphaeria arxii CBS 175.79]|uniref:Aminoacyl-transfer RNA synthetases class-II family profile domain-containing protein n=1 Tax=Aaosphaeria arxii CBS 175.79 TaxID=1450172 RepID=A0A6A5Y8W6_9PLEO|nr:uncharacterized protein BU24DRAFT_417690 [Aaosphaeria arxii CBS 175.79]KAF2022042.1 hypothetical protein BU24DRAFT_417690 [Aaosphaeria arxii CBS 175.79]
MTRTSQTRHHGITPRTLRTNIHNFSSSATVRSNIEPSAGLKETLSNYKATIRSQFSNVYDVDPSLRTACEVGQEVTLFGYLDTRRDVHKNLSFALLRGQDQQYTLQLVSTSQDSSHELFKSLKSWTPVCVRGTLQQRIIPPSDVRDLEKVVEGATVMGDIEVKVNHIEPLNSRPDDLIISSSANYPPEKRHLQLRFKHEQRQPLIFRHQASIIMRDTLNEMGFIETETPLLFKSTPEGAREFLVPTRAKGLAYALPQSPQQYKQILMASGIAKYYQFARCFRDEDLRADRQPEFTQLDMELAFSAEEDVMRVIEILLKTLWQRAGKGHLLLDGDGDFPRMTYHQAMARYGSDKPDLRLGMEITSNITEHLPADLIRKITPLEDPIIDALKFDLDQYPVHNRSIFGQFLESPDGQPFLENPDGAPAVFFCDEKQPLQGLSALGHDFVQNCPEELKMINGEILILQARKNEPFSGGSTALGNLRLALHKEALARDIFDKPKGFKFVWIHDFPLFSPINDVDPGQGGSAGLASTHHPFTAPKTAQDVDLLLKAPEQVIAAHYDIVVNGVELGGGSRRIHDAEVQEFILRDVLKMSSERLEDFRHLLDVLRSGCPPHSGIALGWDRLIAVLLGKDSVRDVIAFPKSGKGEDMLVKSPNAMTEEQLNTYHLQLKSK